jgi:cell division protein FtsL
MTRREAALLLALLLGITASGMGVVYVKYLSRTLFAQSQELRGERDAEDIHHIRLQLEESTLATYGRVEEIARTRLGMHIPRRAEVEVLGGTGDVR